MEWVSLGQCTRTWGIRRWVNGRGHAEESLERSCSEWRGHLIFKKKQRFKCTNTWRCTAHKNITLIRFPPRWLILMCFSHVFLGDQHSDIPASVSYWIHTIGNNSFKIHQVSALGLKTLLNPSNVTCWEPVAQGSLALCLQHSWVLPQASECSLATHRGWQHFYNLHLGMIDLTLTQMLQKTSNTKA